MAWGDILTLLATELVSTHPPTHPQDLPRQKHVFLCILSVNLWRSAALCCLPVTVVSVERQRVHYCSQAASDLRHQLVAISVVAL